jgi:hypothetical protein
MYSTKTSHVNVRMLVIAIISILALAVASSFHQVAAAPLSRTLVRFDRMKISTATTGTVCANPATTATEGDVQVTFPTGYTLGTAGNFTVSTTNLSWPTGGTAWPGITTATNVTGQVVTFPSTDLTVGTLYCFNWTNSAAVTVKSSATANNIGTVATRTAAQAAIDSGSYTTASISDDQIVVTATVPQSFSFALSGNTDALGSLTAGVVTSSPTARTVTVNTNAKNGWMAWARDANAGLSSASASKTIASKTPGTNSTITTLEEAYNTGVTSSQAGGSGTINVALAFAGGGTNGGGLDTTLRTIATSDGTAQNAVLTLTNNVGITSLTPAASDYTDTITVVGAGLF